MLLKDIKSKLSAINGQLTGEVIASCHGIYHGIKRVVTVKGQWICLEIDDYTVQTVKELLNALSSFNLAKELLIKNGNGLFAINSVVVDAAGRLVVVSDDTRVMDGGGENSG